MTNDEYSVLAAVKGRIRQFASQIGSMIGQSDIDLHQQKKSESETEATRSQALDLFHLRLDLAMGEIGQIFTSDSLHLNNQEFTKGEELQLAAELAADSFRTGRKHALNLIGLDVSKFPEVDLTHR
jgi:hypothetical protein